MQRRSNKENTVSIVSSHESLSFSLRQSDEEIIKETANNPNELLLILERLFP